MARAEKLQKQIWANAVTATVVAGAHPDAGKLLLPALNNMIDETTVRTMSLQIHPPTIVYVLLFGVALVFAAGRLPNGKREVAELAPHPRLRRNHGSRRVRQRCMVPADRHVPIDQQHGQRYSGSA